MLNGFAPDGSGNPEFLKAWFYRHFAATNGSPRKWCGKTAFEKRRCSVQPDWAIINLRF